MSFSIGLSQRSRGIFRVADTHSQSRFPLCRFGLPSTKTRERGEAYRSLSVYASARFLKTRKLTFQNFLLVFPVTIASHLSFAVGGQISVGAPRTCVTWAAARVCLLKQTTHPTRHVLQKKSFLKKDTYLSCISADDSKRKFILGAYFEIYKLYTNSYSVY